MDDSQLRDLTSNPVTREVNVKDLVVAYYDRVTQGWRERYGDSLHYAIFTGDESLSDAMAATERSIAEDGGLRPGMMVLDVGCGVGGPALTIAQHAGVHVTGINIVESQLAIARERAAAAGLADRVSFLRADAMDMPFPDASFDAVYVFEAGCHMPDKAIFYQQCARVLKPGGVFLGQDWMRGEGLSAEEDQAYVEPICKYFCIPHMITLSELAQHLQRSGLDVELLESADARGSVALHFQPKERSMVEAVRALGDQMSFTFMMEFEGAVALSEAYQAGAFLIGRWRARKPAAREHGAREQG